MELNKKEKMNNRQRAKLWGCLSIVTFVVTIIAFLIFGNTIYLEKVPAVIVFGMAIVLFFLFVGLIETSFPKCSMCNGYSRLNLNRWQKLRIAVEPILGRVSVGEKCEKCKGRGIIHLAEFYEKHTADGGAEK